jgi:peptide/nickel transport system substrate-binding protein
VLSLLLACTGPSSPSSADGAPVGDTLVIAQQSDLASLNPITAQAAASHNLIDALNVPTLRTSFDCGLKFEEGLVTEWSFSEDSTELSMTLRPDARWSDGTPVTAHDVAFSYGLVANDLVASPRRPFIEHMEPGAMPEVIDDHHMVFHFTKAYDQTVMLGHASDLKLVPRHVLQEADAATLRGHEFSRDPVVTGPWKVLSWDANERLVMEPDPEWWGPEEDRPQLRRVIFKVLPEYATRLMELENGSVDLVEGIQVEDAERLASHPEVTLHRRGPRSTDFLAWNALDAASYNETLERMGPDQMDWSEVQPHPLFHDKQVRKAMSLAIDVDKLVEDLLTGASGEVYGQRAVSTVSPAICGSYNDSIQPLPHDPEQARQMLADLGWGDSDGDGILDKDGRPFAFTLLTNSGNPRRAKAAIIIQANLAEIGVDVQIEKLESNTFFSRLRKKDYEVALSGWSASTWVDMSSLWHSGHRYAQNYPNYSNPRVDELIEQALATPDPAETERLWNEVQALVYEDQPYTFLYWRDEIVGLNSRFEDAQVDFLYPYHRVDRWSVAPDKVKYTR